MKQAVLVIGASVNPARYANMAMKLLQEYDHQVYAIGLREGEVNGIPIQTGEVDFKNLDTITLYLGPQNQPPMYQYILGLNPKRVIFNPGTENPEFQEMLKAKGIEVEVACTLVLLRTNQFAF